MSCTESNHARVHLHFTCKHADTPQIQYLRRQGKYRIRVHQNCKFCPDGRVTDLIMGSLGMDPRCPVEGCTCEYTELNMSKEQFFDFTHS